MCIHCLKLQGSKNLMPHRHFFGHGSAKMEHKYHVDEEHMCFLVDSQIHMLHTQTITANQWIDIIIKQYLYVMVKVHGQCTKIATNSTIQLRNRIPRHYVMATIGMIFL